eukprot:6895116-Alexandrium_andersonii.AAC.1
MQRRVEGWARAQALWLGHSAIAARAPGTTALAVASLWVVVARTQVGAEPPAAWSTWTSLHMLMARRHLVQRNVASIESLVSRMELFHGLKRPLQQFIL